MGVVSHPGKYDTWFIPEEKLPKDRAARHHRAALISQSGAFMLHRSSQCPELAPAYMVSMGNQTDLTLGDMVKFPLSGWSMVEGSMTRYAMPCSQTIYQYFLFATVLFPRPLSISKAACMRTESELRLVSEMNMWALQLTLFLISSPTMFSGKRQEYSQKGKCRS